jgi:ribosomal protein S18 acetylase RimI-like enzyme
MPFTIRPATEEDAYAVHTIIQAAFEEYRFLPVPPGALSDTLDLVRKRMGDGQTVLALDAGRPVGTARYEPQEGHMYVGRVAVLPEYRRLGVATALMHHVEEIARQEGFTRVRLGTRQSMPSNLAFYEHLGYEVVQREEHPRGPDVIVWLEKELT